MRKIVAIFFAFFCYSTAGLYGQSPLKNGPTSSLHEYYIFLSGVNTKKDVLQIEAGIRKKGNVQYFLADRFPVRYFLLKSIERISRATFLNWMPSEKYTLEFYEEGTAALEQLLTNQQKLK